MKLSAFIAAVAAAALLATSAGATAGHHHGITKHDRDVIRFFQHHPRLARTAAGGKALARVLPRVVFLIDARLRAKSLTVAHEALWRCIAGYPGARPGGGSGESGGDNGAVNGQYSGILQMHPDWGDGIYGWAGNYTPEQIMHAAELGYSQAQERGILDSWLTGQWGQTIGPCWGYVT